MKLIVLRHGSASHNLGDSKQHLFAGSQIDHDLSPEGIKDAEKLAIFLKKENIDQIVSSDLKRSVQTAEILVKELNSSGKNVNFIQIPELEEINTGDFSGHNEEETKLLYPAQAEAFYSGDITNWNFPGGENYSEVLKRINIALEKIKLFGDNKTIVLVGHGMTNRILFYKYLSDRKDLWQEREYPHDRIVKLDI